MRARRTATPLGRARSHWRTDSKLREFGETEPPLNSAPAAMPVSATWPTIGMQSRSFLHVNSLDDFSQRRGLVDVQGRPFAAVQRDRQQSAVDQRQGVQRTTLSAAATGPWRRRPAAGGCRAAPSAAARNARRARACGSARPAPPSRCAKRICLSRRKSCRIGCP